MRSWTDAGQAGRVDARGRSELRPLGVLRRGTLFACAVAAFGVRAGTAQGNAPSGRVITAETIAQSRAKTAWDAVRLLVPNLQLRERGDTPTRIQRRGRASIYLDDQVRLIVDNVRIYDIAVLAQIPAGDVLTIELVSGLDATTLYGGNSTSGAIVIHTKSTSP